MRELLRELGVKSWHLVVAGIAVATWLSVIVASGAGWNPLAVRWDFSRPGAFGDSFGPLNTLMATIAALGAIAAYKIQSQELQKSRERQAEQDQIAMSDRARSVSREYESDKRAEKASFETTFFQLLGSWRSIVESIDLTRSGGKAALAQDAFAVMVKNLEYQRAIASEDQVEAWRVCSENHKNDLNHYFRFLYHLVLYVDCSEVSNKYFYVRLVRAMLSEAELLLLALNCEYGEGREKFKELVEKYSLLHNISAESRVSWKLDDFYSETAFERSAEETASMADA